MNTNPASPTAYQIFPFCIVVLKIVCTLVTKTRMPHVLSHRNIVKIDMYTKITSFPLFLAQNMNWVVNFDLIVRPNFYHR